MSLLTRIYNLKSKYRTQQGLISGEETGYAELLKSRQKAVKEQKSYEEGEYAQKESAYEKAKSSYEASQEEYTGQVESFRSEYAPGLAAGSSAEDVAGDFQSGLEKSWMEDLESEEDWAVAYREKKQPKSLADLVETFYWEMRLKQEFKSRYEDPMERIGSSIGGLKAYGEKAAASGEAATAAMGEYAASGETLKSYSDIVSGYTGKLEESKERMRGYGASMSGIQRSLLSSQTLLGLSTEERKRGVRGRRTALTSRSGYA